MGRLFQAGVLAFLIVTRPPAQALAQEAAAVAEARRLRDAGDFPGTIRILEAHLRQYPDDGDALRLLAQSLYWSGDRSRARSTYEHAIALHPVDSETRLAYGRMLIETGDEARALVVLDPLLARPDTRAAAETLLGTLDYWRGDYAGAVRRFRAAVESDPGAVEARRMLGEIAALTAPWIRLTGSGGHDDQPLDRVGSEVEAGWFPSPLWSVALRGTPVRYRPGDSAARFVAGGEAAIAGYAPGLHVDVELAGGVVQRVANRGLEWTGRAAAGFRLGSGFSAGVRAERRPYRYTLASLATPVVVRELAVLIRVNRRGWLGEAALSRQWYPDTNQVSTAYAWILAPLSQGKRIIAQAGYAASFQDAGASRFVPAHPGQPNPPADPRFDSSGRYAPYYTPSHLVSHSVIAALRVVLGGGTAFQAGGSVAVYAREDAPAFVSGGSPPGAVMTTYRRAYTPWSARAGLDQRISGAVSIAAGIERSRTAFYRVTAATVSLTWKPAPAAVGRIARP